MSEYVKKKTVVFSVSNIYEQFVIANEPLLGVNYGKVKLLIHIFLKILPNLVRALPELK